MMRASLFVPRYCVLCTMLRPRLESFCRRRGIDLVIWKVNAQGVGKRVGGPYETVDARAIPAFPALTIAGRPEILVGTGIIAALRRFITTGSFEETAA